jgi:hypothetical protein
LPLWIVSKKGYTGFIAPPGTLSIRRTLSMKTLVMTGVLFTTFIGLGLRAQAPAQDAPSGAPKEHSMAGCLQKGTEAGTFKLTNVDKVGTVDIAESTAPLDPHVGHKIEIAGTAVTGKDPKAHTMKVTGVKMLGTTCP